MVFAELFDERRAPNVEQSRRSGDRAVRFAKRFADQADLDGRHVVLEVDPTVRQSLGRAGLCGGCALGPAGGASLEGLASLNARINACLGVDEVDGVAN